ncbi:MAG: outer membrane protein assembly factor BamB family protein [Gemmatimonadaceae bacterium]
MACAGTARDVPRDLPVEAREYLLVPSRSPSFAEEIDAAPREVWRVSVGRGIMGLPAISSRVTVVTTTDRWVYALDTRNGEMYWRRRGDGVFSVGPAIAGGRVFVASEGTGGRVTAMRLTDGGRIWQTTVGDVASPIVVRDTVVYGVNDDGEAFALGATEGEIMWRRGVGPSKSGPLVLGQHVVIATLRDSMFVVDRVTGMIVASARMPAATASPLARLDDTTVITASPRGSVHALSVPSGRVQWSAELGESIPGAAVVVGDTVFTLSASCTLFRVPHHTPLVSRRDLIDDCLTATAPLVLRDGVLVATVRGDITYLSRSTGRRTWTRSTGGPVRHPPVVLDRQAVVATLAGEVFGFR